MTHDGATAQGIIHHGAKVHQEGKRNVGHHLRSFEKEGGSDVFENISLPQIHRAVIDQVIEVAGESEIRKHGGDGNNRGQDKHDEVEDEELEPDAIDELITLGGLHFEGRADAAVIAPVSAPITTGGKVGS